MPADLEEEFLASRAEVTPAAYCAALNPPPEKAIATREKLLLRVEISYPICEPFPSQSRHALGITVDSRALTYALSCGCKDWVSAVNSRRRGYLDTSGHCKPVVGA